MAQYRVQASFEITVTVEYTIEDTAEAATEEASEAVVQRLTQLAEDHAAAIAENMTLTLDGCDTWELSDVDVTIYALEEIQ